MAKHSSTFLELARRGARVRYEELQTELTALLKEFPDLRSAASEIARRGRRAVSAAATELQGGVARRARPKMTAAQKKAVSARMKRYWAEKRKSKASKA